MGCRRLYTYTYLEGGARFVLEALYALAGGVLASTGYPELLKEYLIRAFEGCTVVGPA
jgi:hypothetical protein